jgi:DMSO/TMAO reductase YedYZ molybdopterin-dependent catalytic subunit
VTTRAAAGRDRRVGRVEQVAAGLVATAAALGVAELVASLAGRGRAAPVVAIGGHVIDATPAWLKDWAISTFGTQDKAALVASILVVLAVLAGLTGLLAARNRNRAAVVIAILALVGAVSATTRPGARWQDALPSLAGGLVAAIALDRLLRRLAPVRAGGDASDTEPAAAPGYDRRAFLLTGLGTLAIGALAGIAGRTGLSGRAELEASRSAVRLPSPTYRQPLPPGTDLRLPGLTPFRTPNRSFYRIDTALLPPEVTAEGWRLHVHGMVEREVELDFESLLARDLIERDITLTCVSNEVGGPLVGSARWLGAPLAAVLREAGVHPDADQLLSRSADGMTIGTPTAVVMDGRDALLAVGMNGKPLPVSHGFPVRMVVPGLYGYVSATKWVVDLELTRFADEQAYWVERGWAERGPVKTMTRIDLPGRLEQVRAGPVTVAGVAWAQHRGIDKVEVRVDGGRWRQARLAAVPSTDTWRQWAVRWDATPGEHLIEARATDSSGTPQTDERTDPVPSGATGWPTKPVTVV